MADLAKHIIIVCSTGRTGTTFFADTLSCVIDGAYSIHEPDIWPGATSRMYHRIRTFGVYHMVIGRLLGRTGMRNLGQRYLSGRMTIDELAAAVVAQRERFYRELPGDPVIEANGQWSVVLPALPRTGWTYRVLAIVRDPRMWVSSSLNHGYVFGRRDLLRRLGYRRLDPEMMGDAKFAEQWPRMSAFEKSCWTWATINRALIHHVERDGNAGFFRYEDLFLDPNRAAHFREMLRFATTFRDRAFDFDFDPSVLQRRVNTAARDWFPDWRDWRQADAWRLEEICGPLMRKFGYGNEADWGALLDDGTIPEGRGDRPRAAG